MEIREILELVRSGSMSIEEAEEDLNEQRENSVPGMRDGDQR